MMESIDLNLASRPIRNNTLLWVGHSVLGVTLLGATVWNVTSYLTSRSALSDLTAQRDSFQSRMNNLARRESGAKKGIAAFDVKELEVKASKASDVIERKALSWTRLFNRMEEVFPYEVRMVSVRPVFKSQRTSAADREGIPEGAIPVSVEGIARNFDAFLELERALIFDPHFDAVDPYRYDRIESGEVRFDLRFLYYPDPPPENATSREDGSAAPVGETPPASEPADVSDPWEGSTEDVPGAPVGEGAEFVEEAEQP